MLLVAVNLAAAAFFLLSYTRHGIGFGRYRIDLDVYRISGRVWLRHGDLYGVLPATSSGVRLPFSYPPIAAALLSPLSLAPLAVDGTVLTLCGVALTALVLWVFLRSAAGPRAGSWWAVCWLLPVALFLEPMRNTLDYGQVNIVLMALVTLDCLPAAVRWPRGTLVGIAAAVKLTPAAFVLFFLLRGDRRAAGTAAVSFAACGAAGFLLAWHDSVRYWASVVFQTGRPGSLVYAANQSIEAVIGRAGLDPHAPAGTAMWLAASAAVFAAACAGMRRAIASSEDAWALSLNAFAGLLISPVSWSHHWVWAEPALLVLAARGPGRPGDRRGGACRLRRRAAVVVSARREPRAPLGRVAAGRRQLLRDLRHRRPAAVRCCLAGAERPGAVAEQGGGGREQYPADDRRVDEDRGRRADAEGLQADKRDRDEDREDRHHDQGGAGHDPALEAMPPTTASSGDAPRARGSRTRLRMNTW
jgi:alpha-1,2-mannosyltransferase